MFTIHCSDSYRWMQETGERSVKSRRFSVSCLAIALYYTLVTQTDHVSWGLFILCLTFFLNWPSQQVVMHCTYHCLGVTNLQFQHPSAVLCYENLFCLWTCCVYLSHHDFLNGADLRLLWVEHFQTVLYFGKKCCQSVCWFMLDWLVF